MVFLVKSFRTPNADRHLAPSSTSRMEACHAGVPLHLNRIFEGNYPSFGVPPRRSIAEISSFVRMGFVTYPSMPADKQRC